MEDFLSDNVEVVHKIDVGAIVRFENLNIEGLNAQHGPLPVKLLAGLIDIKNEIAQGTHGGKKVFLGPVKRQNPCQIIQSRMEQHANLLRASLSFELLTKSLLIMHAEIKNCL